MVMLLLMVICFRRVKLLDYDIDDQYFHSLYVPGDHHPSLMGSYLSALLHFMSLYKVPVVILSYDMSMLISPLILSNVCKVSNDNKIPDLGVDPFFAILLKLVADETYNSQEWELGSQSQCDNSLCRKISQAEPYQTKVRPGPAWANLDQADCA